MIKNKGYINVDSGIRYLGKWKGMYSIPSGRIIINKVLTGCGMTTWYLTNSKNVVLISPRTELAISKIGQIPFIYYFDREIDHKKDMAEQDRLLGNYLFSRSQDGRPVKLIVTYDSFPLLSDKLKNEFRTDLGNFRLVIDECQCLLKDCKMKETKNTITNLLNTLFQYENLMFISATPMIDYLAKIQHFRMYDVDYYELKWPGVFEVKEIKHSCRSSLDAFDQVYKKYIKDGYFAVLCDDQCNVAYSTEAVFFLNDVADIIKIIRKYGLHKDSNILCGRNKTNKAKLKKEGLSIGSIPKEGEPHKRYTFCTRCCFEGCDFYSECASTYVIANYNIDCLSIDIASDIPQIVGRQRLDRNVFKHYIHVYYVGNRSVLNDQEFAESQKKKLDYSQRKIENWKSAVYKDESLDDIDRLMKCDPNSAYLSTAGGVADINNLLILAEQYSYDVLKNHKGWFSISDCQVNQLPSTDAVVLQLKNELDGVKSNKTNRDRIRKIYDYFIQYPTLRAGFMEMLCTEGYDSLAYYFHKLPLERIKYNSGDPTKMDAEIAQNNP